MLKVKEAKEELNKKSYRDIQVETAWKWASRAAASYDNVLSASRDKKVITWTIAGEYYHEAIEHAALVEDGAASLLKEIQNQVGQYEAKAFDDLEIEFDQQLKDT